MTLLRHLDYPPVWLLFFMALVWIMGAAWAPIGDWMLWPGRALIAAGIALAVWSAWEFRRARTTLIPRGEPSALVTTGPYARSRNPIYLADLMILAGWALVCGTFIGLFLLLPFREVLLRRFILPEEAVLEAHLGAEFAAYRARVGRWFGAGEPGPHG